MAKIGRDVTDNPRAIVKLRLNSSRRGYKSEGYREKILQVLRSAKRPLCITAVSKTADINYATTRGILMEFLLVGLVTRVEAGGAIFYQIKK